MKDVKSAWPSAVLRGMDTPSHQSVTLQNVSSGRSGWLRLAHLLLGAGRRGSPWCCRNCSPGRIVLEYDALVDRPRRLAIALETSARIAAWDPLRGAGRRRPMRSLMSLWSMALSTCRVEISSTLRRVRREEVERDYASFETAWRKRRSDADRCGPCHARGA